jgi:uncharacterized damage-inducible protein DinB
MKEKSMTTREYFLARLKAEIPAFVRVIKALPADRADYRPHPKSRSAAELAWMLAGSMQGGVELADKGRIEWRDPAAAKGVEGAAEALETAANALLARAEKLDDARWEREAELSMGGKVVWKEPLGGMLWGFLFDSVHHRGQLSTYIRPMGGKVPSIYGPSGDDAGA